MYNLYLFDFSFQVSQWEIGTHCITQLNFITIVTPKTKVIGLHSDTCEPVINNNSVNISNLELSHIMYEHHRCANEKCPNNTSKTMNMLKQYNTLRHATPLTGHMYMKWQTIKANDHYIA